MGVNEWLSLSPVLQSAECHLEHFIWKGIISVFFHRETIFDSFPLSSWKHGFKKKTKKQLLDCSVKTEHK